jgi:FkbM family methyltransferase
MQLDLEEYLSADIFAHGGSEPLTIDLFKTLLKPGDAYADVGAHVGFHTLIARKLVGADGLVVAVEPQPWNAARLLGNWQLNDFSNLQLHIGAAGEHSGQVELNPQPNSDRARLSLSEETNRQEAVFTVPVLSLSDILKKNDRRYRLIKIDVEGFELEVVNGLKAAFDLIDNVLIEILDTKDPCERSTAVFSLLEASGFTLKTVTGQQFCYGEDVPEHNIWASRRST